MSDLNASTVAAYTRYLKALSRGRITVPAGNNILQNLQNRGLARRVRTTDDFLTEWEITEAGRAALKAAMEVQE